MGVYYRWRCDGTQEYFDPGMLLGPKCPPGGGYGIIEPACAQCGTPDEYADYVRSFPMTRLLIT